MYVTFWEEDKISPVRELPVLQKKKTIFSKASTFTFFVVSKIFLPWIAQYQQFYNIRSWIPIYFVLSPHDRSFENSPHVFSTKCGIVDLELSSTCSPIMLKSWLILRSGPFMVLSIIIQILLVASNTIDPSANPFKANEWKLCIMYQGRKNFRTVFSKK